MVNKWDVLWETPTCFRMHAIKHHFQVRDSESYSESYCRLSKARLVLWNGLQDHEQPNNQPHFKTIHHVEQATEQSKSQETETQPPNTNKTSTWDTPGTLPRCSGDLLFSWAAVCRHRAGFRWHYQSRWLWSLGTSSWEVCKCGCICVCVCVSFRQKYITERYL